MTAYRERLNNGDYQPPTVTTAVDLSGRKIAQAVTEDQAKQPKRRGRPPKTAAKTS